MAKLSVEQLFVCKLGILLFLLTDLLSAQYVVGAKAGTVQFMVGSVYLDDQHLQKTSLAFPVVKDQQTLRTGRGRVELLLAPGVFLRLGQQSAIRMVDNRLDSTVVDVQKGRALIEAVQLVKDSHIQVQCGEASTQFRKTGLYRFDADVQDLQVFAGEAEVAVGEQQRSVTRNRRVSLQGTIAVSPFHRNVDTLYKWAAMRSFDLFRAHLASSNWIYTALGWFWNPDYEAQATTGGSMLRYLPPERAPR